MTFPKFYKNKFVAKSKSLVHGQGSDKKLQCKVHPCHMTSQNPFFSSSLGSFVSPWRIWSCMMYITCFRLKVVHSLHLQKHQEISTLQLPESPLSPTLHCFFPLLWFTQYWSTADYMGKLELGVAKVSVVVHSIWIIKGHHMGTKTCVSMPRQLRCIDEVTEQVRDHQAM